MSKCYAIEQREEISAGKYHYTIIVHASGDPGGGYSTMCGMDADDDFDFTETRSVDVPDNAKINCMQCKNLFDRMAKFKQSDFE